MTNTEPNTDRTCWIVTEGLTGTENPCRGVADALGWEQTIKRVVPRFPWAQLGPWLRIGGRHAYPHSAGIFDRPPPDLVITSGRKAILAGLELKRRGSRLLHIQDPKISARHFDLVAAPRHDPVRGENVIITDTAPSRITDALLAEARAAWHGKLSSLPAPRIAVLIGGNSRAYNCTGQDFDCLISALRHMRQSGAGLMLTASRRTPASCRAKLRAAFGTDPGVFYYDGTGPNPYHGFLAWADYIVVSRDSVSMTSEAAATGKPVLVAPLTPKGRRAKRLETFHRNLEALGVARPLAADLPAPWSYTPLRPAADIAQALARLP